MVVLYFVGTTSAFLKSAVLPRIAAALHAQITVEDLSLSPFSQLVLRGLKVQTTGTEPLLQAEEVRVRYSLWSIWRGQLAISEATLVAPVIRIEEQSDGASNLDPLLAGFKAQPGTSPGAARAAAPPQLNLSNIKVSQGTVRYLQNLKGGGRQSLELSQLNISLDRLKNATAGKLTLAGSLSYGTGPGSPGPPQPLQAQFNGEYDFALDPRLVPLTIKGATRANAPQAEGPWRDLTPISATLECELTPTELRGLSLRFEREGKALGQFRASGPLTLTSLEGRLKVDLNGVDRQVLNLVGVRHGLDFGATTLSSTNIVNIEKTGSLIEVRGHLEGRQLSVQRAGVTIPPVNLGSDYQVTCNLKDETVTIQKMDLRGAQQAGELLRAGLDRPMILSWGPNPGGLRESVFQLSVTNLNLADWKTILGETVSRGIVNLNLKVRAQKDGQQLWLELGTTIHDLAARWKTNQIQLSQFTGELNGQLTKFHEISIEKFRFAATDANQGLINANGSLRCDLQSPEKRLQTTFDLLLPALLKQIPVPALTAQSGTVKCSGLFTYTPQQQQFHGSVMIGNFTGRFRDWQFKDYQAGLDTDVDVVGALARVSRAILSARPGVDPVSSIELTGDYDLNKKSGQCQFKTLDLNQNVLRPFLDPAMAPRRLGSIHLKAEGTAGIDLEGDSTLKSKMEIRDLLIEDSARRLPTLPPSLDLQVDGTAHQLKQITIRQLAVVLRCQGVNAGSADLSGRLDLNTKAAQLSFKVQDVNQLALGPILNPTLAPCLLESVMVNTSGDLNYQPQGDSLLQATCTATNLVIHSPAATSAPNPESLQLKVNASIHENTMDLRQCDLTFAPTRRAANQAQLQGKLDLANTNGLSGRLTLQAESLDFTPLYEVFQAPTNAPAAPKTATPARPAAVEPAVATLPCNQLVAEMKIGRLYLGEIAITNWQASVLANPHDLSINPFSLVLNGAPVQGNATLNLGVPGYTYDLSFQATNVPIAPLADTFAPSSMGRYQGSASVQAHVKGSGVTGASLQKSLNGNASFSLTNANFQLVSAKAQTLLAPVVLLLRIPEITQSPVDSIWANADLGGGAINIKQATVLSAAFKAETAGAITLAPVLTNSPLNLPITLSLRRALAEKSNLLPANTPTNAVYVQLPNFVKVTGTLGNYKTEMDKLVISGLLLRSAAGLPAGAGNQTVNLLQGVGNLLSGQPQPASVTNPVSVLPPRAQTNLNPLSNLASNLLVFPSTTRTPATATNPPANPMNILQQLLRK